VGALPENRFLSSAKLFAEYFFRALGKEETLGKDCFAECQILCRVSDLALGKELFTKCFFIDTR
jgi:hypothetical protein